MAVTAAATGAQGVGSAEETPWPSPWRSWYAVAVLLVAYTVSFVDRSIMALLVVPIQADLGIGDTEISLLHGFAFAIFYTTLGIPIARLADRMSRRRIIAIGIAVWSLATALCGLTQRFWQLFLARVGVGVGEAALSPAAYSMIADLFPKRQLARALAVYSTGVYIGAGLAFIIGGWVIQTVSEASAISLPLVGELKPWQLTFIVVGLPGLLVALWMLSVREPARRGTRADDNILPFSDVLRFVREHKRVYYAHFFGFSLIGIVFNGFLAWTPTLLIRRFDYSAPEAGLVLGILLLVLGTLGIVAGGALADWLESRGRKDGTMIVGLIAGIVLTPLAILAPLAGTAALTIALLSVFFFFSSFPYGASAAALQMITPNRMRAQVSAIYLLTLNLLGIGLSATAIALVTDFVLGDPQRIGSSMAIVGGIAAPFGALLLYRGLRPFSERVRAVEAGVGGAP